MNNLKSLTAKLDKLYDQRNSLVPFSKPFNEVNLEIAKVKKELEDISPAKNLFMDVLLYLTIILAFFFMVWILSSCSNSKKVSNQVNGIAALKNKMDSLEAAALAKGIADFVKNNPCQCPAVNLDSLCGLYFPCGDNTNGFSNGFDFSLNASTTPVAKPELKEKSVPGTNKISRPTIILQPYNDSRLVNLQVDSLNELRRRLSECQGNIAGRKQTIAEAIDAGKPGKWAFNYWSWIAIAFTLLYILKIYLTKKFW